MNLNRFYQKYLHAFGVPIISSNLAKDAALRRACYVVVFTLADRKDIRRMFFKNHGRAAVISIREQVTTIPEHSWLPSWWNQRARGLGGTMQNPISTCTYRACSSRYVSVCRFIAHSVRLPVVQMFGIFIKKRRPCGHCTG